jgi:hypothetical protein
MRPKRSFCLILLLAGLSMMLPAQEEGGPLDTDWSGIMPNLYSRGDQVFTLNLGLVFPLMFIDQDRGKLANNIGLGGMGLLGWNYFLGPHLFIGAELSGMFASTVAENHFFMVPFGIRGGYQFILGRFEFPLSLLLGAAAQVRLQDSYMGFFAKPTLGIYFRWNPEWSFGVLTEFWWVPQFTSTADVHGFFMDAVIGVRYHF